MIVPLFIFRDSDSTPPIVPAWLNVFGVIVISLFLLGLMGIVITMLLNIVFDRDCEGLFKTSIATVLISAILLMIFVFLALIFGK